MTTKSAGKLSFILYEEKKAPKYFEITKSSLRFFIIGLPLITCLSIAGFLMAALYTKIIKMDISPLSPSLEIKEFQIKNEQLLAANKKLQSKNFDLTQALDLAKEKISVSPSSPHTTEIKATTQSLSLFPPVPGRKDQSDPSVLSLRQGQLVLENGNIVFSFGMANKQKEDTRINGHLIVMMKYEGLLYFYPQNILDTKLQVPHASGEYFSFSRFRPVKAAFPYPKKDKDMNDDDIAKMISNKNFFFKVFIFSKEGDLLHRQIFRKKIQPLKKG